MMQSIQTWLFFVVLSLKTTSATTLYTNLDIPESRNFIDRHTGDESVPKNYGYVQKLLRYNGGANVSQSMNLEGYH
jgi:hypothetical protein